MLYQTLKVALSTFNAEEGGTHAALAHY